MNIPQHPSTKLKMTPTILEQMSKNKHCSIVWTVAADPGGGASLFMERGRVKISGNDTCNFLHPL